MPRLATPVAIFELVGRKTKVRPALASGGQFFEFTGVQEPTFSLPLPDCHATKLAPVPTRFVTSHQWPDTLANENGL
jgi:hypothetical protein